MNDTQQGKHIPEYLRAAHASEEAEAQDIRNTETPYPRAAHASEPDILQRLQYIADSPPSDDGGFHEQAIQTAKDAIEFIKTETLKREELIDAIVGDLVRETNIFPNQVARAKELIRERLNEKVS